MDMIDMLISDSSVPKNVRKAIEKAKAHLVGEKDFVVMSTSAIYEIDAVADDINMPVHARTHLWHLISALEALKE